MSRQFEHETLSIRRELVRWRQRATMNRDLALERSRQAEWDRRFNAVNRAAEADRRTQQLLNVNARRKPGRPRESAAIKILTSANVWPTRVSGRRANGNGWPIYATPPPTNAIGSPTNATAGRPA